MLMLLSFIFFRLISMVAIASFFFTLPFAVLRLLVYANASQACTAARGLLLA